MSKETVKATAPPPSKPQAPSVKANDTVKQVEKEVFKVSAPNAASEKDAPPKIPETDLLDKPDAKIEVGSKCKRPSCGKPFVGEESRMEECVFHSGSPVFHEGSKGWSCCSRKAGFCIIF